MLNSTKNKEKAILSSSILLVDDMEFNLIILKEIFSSYGFTNIHVAGDGKEALEKTKEIRPDLVILDLVMPNMDGYEYCETVRDDPEFSDIPVLIQTAITVPGQRAKAFKCGATDLINKPIDADEIIARSIIHLEKKHLLQEIRHSQYRMKQELIAAGVMQQQLLPTEEEREEIKKTHNVTINCLFETSSELGGDLWGIHPISDDKLSFFVVDLSGHGVTAALNTFRLHALMERSSHTNLAHDPGAYLENLSRTIYSLLSIEEYATMFYGVMDVKHHKIRYACAGAPSPLLLLKEQNTIERIDGTGFPIGVISDATYETHEIDFHPNDSIFIYSDALIETEDADGKFFMLETIESIFKANLHKKHDTAFNELLQTFNRNYFSHLHDDLTLVMLSHEL